MSMWVIGLTGSIGMGKSTVAKWLRELDVPVSDADATVHELYGPGGAAGPLIAAEFKGVVGADGAVDRGALSKYVVAPPDAPSEKQAAAATAMATLEAIVHPLVKKARDDWLEERRAERAPLAVLDIPLLYETKLEGECDEIVVVSAPAAAQRERVLARPKMTEEKFKAILAKQVPDEEKRRRAGVVIDTGADACVTRQAVADFVASRRGRVLLRRRLATLQRAAVRTTRAAIVAIVLARFARSRVGRLLA